MLNVSGLTIPVIRDLISARIATGRILRPERNRAVTKWYSLAHTLIQRINASKPHQHVMDVMPQAW